MKTILKTLIWDGLEKIKKFGNQLLPLVSIHEPAFLFRKQ